LFGIIRQLQRRLFPPREIIEGYEQAELVEMVFQKTKAFVPEGDWPLMAGVSSVLDFGGGCGLHYKLARRQSPDIRWAVVETPAMARRAAELATERLRFFADIGEAQNWLGTPEMMHSNGALQYTPEPRLTLQQLCSLKASRMCWDRVLLSNSGWQREVQSSYLTDNGPGRAPGATEKLVKYDRTGIPEVEFLAAHSDYDLMEHGKDWFRFSLKP
jgi:putative methyltransferase (TIGR04325 family)